MATMSSPGSSAVENSPVKKPSAASVRLPVRMLAFSASTAAG
jgi:hypothetical protein